VYGLDKLHIAAVFFYVFRGKIVFNGEVGIIGQPFFDAPELAPNGNLVFVPIKTWETGNRLYEW
jgi:hypothetical protein